MSGVVSEIVAAGDLIGYGRALLAKAAATGGT
jgi:hypothetical protein